MITVLAHGCFEILHPGHRAHLWDAYRLGDKLIVSVTPDQFVGKGPGRPIFSLRHRMAVLKALWFVDTVCSFDGPDCAVKAILYHRPKIYAKGAEYENGDTTGNLERERIAVESVGGRLAIVRSTPVFSSTDIVSGKRLADRIAKVTA